jgi:chromosome segregation ATPase
MTEERDMWHMRWQKEVPPLEKEIKTIAERHRQEIQAIAERHRQELREVRVRAACDLAAVRGEIMLSEEEIQILLPWRQRFEAVTEEMKVLKKSHQMLLQEFKELKLEYERYKVEIEKKYAAEIAKLIKERDELKEEIRVKIPPLQNEIEKLKEELRVKIPPLEREIEKLKGEVDRLKAQLPPLKALAELHLKTCVNEIKLLEREKGDIDGLLEDAKRRIRLEYECYLAAITKEIAPLEALYLEMRQMEERFEAAKRSLLEELEYQRAENRKIKLLVEEARRRAEEAEKKLEEVEAACKAALEAMRRELEKLAEECRRKVAQLEELLKSAEEAHERTKRELEEVKVKIPPLQDEILRLINELKVLLAEFKELESKFVKLEVVYDTVRIEAAEVETELKDRMECVIDQTTTRLEVESKSLVVLDQMTRDFETSQVSRDYDWQSRIDELLERIRQLLEDREELQARFDWLLVRFTGREPRQQDIAMMQRLQEELSRQMYMTAEAVQQARDYKEALRTNDAAYTRLFGQGSLHDGDYVSLHNELVIEDNARDSEVGGTRKRPGSPACSSRMSSRPTSARPARPGSGIPNALRVAGPDGAPMAPTRTSPPPSTRTSPPRIMAPSPTPEAQPPSIVPNLRPPSSMPPSRPASGSPRTRMGAATHRPIAMRGGHPPATITAPIVRPLSASARGIRSGVPSGYAAPGAKQPTAVTMPVGALSMEEVLSKAAETVSTSHVIAGAYSLRPTGCSRPCSPRPSTVPGAEGVGDFVSLAAVPHPQRGAQMHLRSPTPTGGSPVSQVIARLAESPPSPPTGPARGWDAWE